MALHYRVYDIRTNSRNVYAHGLVVERAARCTKPRDITLASTNRLPMTVLEGIRHYSLPSAPIAVGASRGIDALQQWRRHYDRDALKINPNSRK